MISSFTFQLIPATISSQVASGQWLSFVPEWLQIIVTLLALIIVPVAFVILFVGMWRKVFYTIWYVISLQPLRRSLLRRKLARGLEYYRDAPAEALCIEWKSTMYGAEPHTVLIINKKATPKGMSDIEQGFFSLMEGAAGADGILQPRELQQYIRHNDVPFFKEIAKLNDREKALANAPETPQQLLGLRKYLLDFSLIGEREIKEMTLWKEYLVYATLFGIADKVCDNFATVYPDFFQANSIAVTRLNIVGNNALVSYVSASLEGMKERRS